MNLLFRVLSSVALLPFVIYLLWQGGLGFTCLILVAFAVSLFEYTTMVMNHHRGWQVASILVSLIALVFISAALSPIGIIVLIGALCFAIGTYFTLNPDLPLLQFEKVCVLLFGVFYIGSGLLSVYLLRTGGTLTGQSDLGLQFIFLLLLATFSNDTFAYFVGKWLGKHHLSEKVSAKKTWEGFFGGALFTVVIPFAIQALFANMGVMLFALLSARDIFFITIPIIFLAPLGDLIESRIKRFYGFKDSGKILPGHGGLLDRIDALLITSLWVAAYAFFLRTTW